MWLVIQPVLQAAQLEALKPEVEASHAQLQAAKGDAEHARTEAAAQLTASQLEIGELRTAVATLSQDGDRSQLLFQLEVSRSSRPCRSPCVVPPVGLACSELRSPTCPNPADHRP